ncbi:P60-like protein [Wolfiporia cocos MD-104 SS10]|uniref:Ribosome biogenesis protein NOP53 n=1 Tax=Wolfiporia cocos (strain MD-104) TaxID=742152 RepID=A0A2H3JCC8_WOLCO|nr:P60-like protein [Wolfiporia cocos MD-104 SS10]
MSVKPAPTHAPSTAKTKNAASSVGAPAQHNQSSRKGKKAWRKNVNIEEIEEGMEGLRAEERVTGSILQKKTDQELFQIDVKGDEHVRKARSKFSNSLLTSAKILAQRSAVPAVHSRASSASALKRKTPTYDEKGRLLRISKRQRRGLFNTVVDTTKVGAGSALMELSEAAKKSGTYDVWTDSVEGTNVKPPSTPHPRAHITLPAVPSPHEGTSYNPLVSSHQELLRTAHEIEEQRVKKAAELNKFKAQMAAASRLATIDEPKGVAPGMLVDEVREGEEDVDAEPTGERVVKKMPARKTKQQRRKAERLRAERRALEEKRARKRTLASIDSAKSMRKALKRSMAARERLHAQRHEAELEKRKKGLAGQRVGKHKVPEGEIDVQLGDELSESLRALKPEGNLFRDRFLSMQHRALIEPRVPILTKQRRAKMKEYEKHAWKRFDREQ